MFLSFATIVVCLVLGEIADRLRDPDASLWRYPNYIEAWVAEKYAHEGQPTIRHDSEIGYEPIPRTSAKTGNAQISYSAQGFRNQNAGVPPAAGPLILALGDSYTEGWMVGDDESWPAHLERDTGRRVINAAVSGYGLDQIVLRAERLMPQLRPATLVLAFIGSDIDRTTQSYRDFQPKPYFVPTGDGLELRNVPVPTSAKEGVLTAARRILGYSHLLDSVMRRIGAYDLWYGNNMDVGGDGVVVSCRLMERFATLVREQKVEALVVAFQQYDAFNGGLTRGEVRDRVSTVLACAEKASLATLDTSIAFDAAGANRDPEAFFVGWHYSDRGNALAAKLIAAALKPAKN